jgi:hypothetical protein
VIARNPADVFKRRLPKLERKEMAVLTPEQSAALLDETRPTPLYLPVMLALATGMRRGEILALRWRNVDLDRGLVRATESLEQVKGGLRFNPPKSGRARVITLPSVAIEELRERKRAQAEQLLKLGIRQSGNTLVCARPDGQPTKPLGLSNMFFKIHSQDAGSADGALPRFAPYARYPATPSRRSSPHCAGAARSFHRCTDARPLQPRHQDDAGGGSGEDRCRLSRSLKAGSVAISVAPPATEPNSIK